MADTTIHQRNRRGFISIRAKILIAVFVSLAIPAVLFVLVGYSSTRASLSRELGENLHLIAGYEANDIEEILSEEIRLLDNLVDTPDVQQALGQINSFYSGTPEEIEAQLIARDAEWVAAAADSPLVQESINFTITRLLNALIDDMPEASELFVTDRYGAVVASTTRPSDYYQGDEAWWQAAFNNGEGTIYIADEFAFDESTQADILQMALPIRQGERVVGIIRSSFRIETFSQDLANVQLGTSGHGYLLNAEGRVIASSNPEAVGQILPGLPAILAEQNDDESPTIHTTTDVDNTPVVLAANQVTSNDVTEAIDNLGWYVAVVQDEAEAFAPLQSRIVSSLLQTVVGFGVIVGATVLFARSITRPLDKLTKAAQELGTSNWNTRVDIFTNDELGILGNTFNRMAGQIQETLGTLEERVSSRTRDMEIAADVTQKISTTLDLDELLQSVSDVTKTRFNLYHAHVYLTSPDHKNLVLAAGAGEAGRTMVVRGHTIPMNHPHSLVASAARNRRGIMVNNVTKNPDFLPNPLLPNTKSELALPMIVGDKLVGVLDVQSDKFDNFDLDDLRVQTTLAGQIAVAVENARQFTVTQQRLFDLQLTSRIAEIIRAGTDIDPTLEEIFSEVIKSLDADSAVYSEFNYQRQMWYGRIGAGEGLTSALAQTFIDPAATYPHGMEALQTGRIVTVDNASEYPDFPKNYIETLGLKSVAVLPIYAGSIVAGVVFVNFNRAYHSFTPEEVTLFANISNQISSGIERKLAQSQTELYADVMANTPIGLYVWRLEDISNPASLRLLTANEASFHATGVRPETIIGKTMAEAFPGLMETQIPNIYANVALNRQVLDLGLIEYGDANVAQSVFSVKAFTLPDNSTGVSFENVTDRVRAEQLAERRAAEIETVAQVGAQIATNLNLEDLLWSVANLTKENFKRYHAHIYLLDDSGEHLVLRAGAGETGRRMVELGHSISLNREQSIVAQAARTHKAVVIQDVTEEPNFMPNPLLPDTRSEIAVPIMLGDTLIGVLDVQDTPANAFDELEVQAKTVLANQVAVAIQNARAFEAAETARRETNQIYELSTDLIGTAQDGYLKVLNPAWEHVLGWSLDELRAKPFLEFVHPEDQQSTLDEYLRQLGEGRASIQFENRYVTKDGGFRWLSWNAVPAGTTTYFVTRDITERRDQDQALIASEARFRDIADTSPGAIYQFSAAETGWKMEYISPAIERIAGVSPDAVMADINALIGTFYPADVDGFVTSVSAVLETLSPWNYEARLIHKVTGALHWWQGSSIPHKREDGSVVFTGLLQDITDRKQAQKQVDDLRAAIDEAAIVAITDVTGKITYVNDRFCEISQYSREELMGQDHRIINSSYHSKEFIRDLWVTIANGNVWRGELRNKAKDGSHYWVDTTIVPLVNAAGKPEEYIAIRYEITERKAQETLIAARAAQVETVALVGSQIATNLELQELLWSVADLTKENFDRYHVNIYLLDHDSLVLAAASDEVGRKLVAKGHRIPMQLENSLVARAARERTPVVVEDVSANPDYLPNPLLMETRSELALPIIVGQELIGVLDVQDNKLDAFQDVDVQAKSILANQIAVAVQNARSFEETREAREEAETLYRISEAINAANSPKDMLDAASVNAGIPYYATTLIAFEGYNRDSASYFETLAISSPTPEKLVQQAGMRLPMTYFPQAYDLLPRTLLIVEDVDNRSQVDEMTAESLKGLGYYAYITVTIALGGRIMGTLNFFSDKPRRFNERQVRVAESIADLIAAALERERLQSLTADARAQAETLATINAALSQANDEQAILEAVAEFVERYNTTYTGLLYTAADDANEVVSADIKALRSGDGQAIPLETLPTTHVRREFYPILKFMSAKPDELVVIEDVNTHPGLTDAEREIVRTSGSCALVVVPLFAGDQWQGLMTFNWAEPQRFDAHLVEMAAAIRPTAASAVASRRAYLAEEEARREAETLYRIGEAINAASSPHDMLDAIAHISGIPAFAYNIISFEGYNRDTADYFEVLAISSPTPEKLVQQAGMRFPMTAFPQAYDIVPRATLVVEDVDNRAFVDEVSAEGYKMLGYRGFISVIISLGNRIMGTMNFFQAEPRPFTASEIRVAESTADLMAAALERERLQHESENARQEAEVLYRISEAINAAITPTEMLDAITQFSHIDHYAITLVAFEDYDRDTATYFETLAIASPTPQKLVQQAGMRLPMTYFPQAYGLQPRQTLIIEDVDDRSRVDEVTAESLKGLGYYAYITPVISIGNRIMGTLNFFSDKPRQFTVAEIRRAESISDLLAAALERERLQRESEQAREEAEILYQVSAAINVAETLNDVINAIVPFVTDETTRSITLNLYDSLDYDTAAVVKAVADWTRDGRSMTGMELNMDDFPLAKLLNMEEVVWFDDLTTAEALTEANREMLAQFGMRSLIIAPVYVSRRCAGNLTIARSEPNQHTLRDVRILNSISEQLSAAVERFQLTEQTLRRARELETVARVSAATTTLLNPEELMQSVADLTKESFNLYHAHIYLVDEENAAMVLAAGAGEPGRKMKDNAHRIPLARTNSLVVQAALQRKGIIANDVTINTDFLPNPLLPETKSEMAIPMIIGERLIGVLDVQADVVNRFTPEDVRIKTALADQIAVAVENARSFAEAAERAEREREIAEQLREVDRLKSQFLANMSHELRTPLNSIIGYSEVLLDGVDGDLTDDAHEDVQAIHNSGKHLLSLINEILDLAKIEAGEMRLDFRPVNVADIARDIVRTGQVLVKDKPVSLDVEIYDNIPTVEADPIRLRQIILNLVSNAAKFTEKGAVQVVVDMLDEEFVRVAVRDTGIGIRDDKLHLVFERFSQVDGSSTRRAGGTGLGLTITKQLVEMHGGQIDVESVYGEGSTFWFTLPLTQPIKMTTMKVNA
ncbi:MAG: GAF domain-containing protein [bacterium]|nr:GAF domain-containing protein [bacterium]